MIKIFILFATFFGLCHILVAWTRSIPSTAPSAVIGMITGTLFLSDFIGALHETTIGLILVGLLGALHHLTGAWKNRVVYVEKLKKSGQSLLWFLIFCMFFGMYAINYSMEFKQWDEFSHWGTIIKAIYQSNTFHFNPNPLYFQDYPPGTALFAYFVMSIMGYAEGVAYFSYSLIIISYCIPIWSIANDKGKSALYMAFTFSLILVKLMGHGWSSVLIDHILSVCFAGVLAGYLITQKEDAPRWPLALSFITLVLAKHAGISMALVLLALIIIDSMVMDLNRFEKKKSFYLKIITRRAIDGILLILPAILLSYLWNEHVKDNELARGYGRYSIIELVQKGLSCCTTDRDKTIFTRYFDQWLGLPQLISQSLQTSTSFADYIISRVPHLGVTIWTSASMISVLIVAIGTISVLLSKKGIGRQRQLFSFLTLTFAGIMFGIVQLLFYLYAFPDYEALQIASFRRFNNTYTLAWALSTLTWVMMIPQEITEVPLERKRSGGIRLLITVVSAILLILLSIRALLTSNINSSELSQRHELQKWLEVIALSKEKTAKIFIVWQGSNGFEFWKTHYELIPIMTNRDCYSLGAPHNSNDIWSCPWDEIKLRKEWAKYSHVLVVHGYTDLQYKYPNLLPNLGIETERHLLRIDLKDGEITLSPITQINEN